MDKTIQKQFLTSSRKVPCSKQNPCSYTESRSVSKTASWVKTIQRQFLTPSRRVPYSDVEPVPIDRDALTINYTGLPSHIVCSVRHTLADPEMLEPQAVQVELHHLVHDLAELRIQAVHVQCFAVRSIDAVDVEHIVVRARPCDPDAEKKQSEHILFEGLH